MKYIVVVLAGAADQPAAELGEKTPLDIAKIPNLHHFSKIGKVGQAKLFSDKMDASSDVTLLNLLGYNADKVYTGRGPLEAANLELKLEENEIAFRMNFITESDGKLADPTAGHLSTKEAKALINYLNKKVASGFVRFFPGAEYRHIAVIKDAHGYEALSARTTSPETIVGEKIDGHFPKGPGEDVLKKLMYDAKLLLQDHEINQVRLDLKENPANMIWLWGQGKKPLMESFQSLYGLTGAIMTDIEYAKGVARLAGLTVIETPETAAHADTDYDRIGKMIPEMLQEKDFVTVYLRDADEASRVGDAKAKISALEAADFFVLSRIKDYAEKHKDVRILITPCHAAPWKLKNHAKEAVPAVVAGKNVTPDDIDRFSETTARVSELKFQSGQELMKFFLTK